MVKHIKLFENFNQEYKWPDAMFWLNKLYPEEICFLALYSLDLKKDKLFEVVYEGSTDVDPDEAGSGSFETFFKIPMSGGNGYSSLSCEMSFRGDFTPYDSGDYYNPPEGGDYILEDIDTEFANYIDELDENESDLLSMEYQSEFIKKDTMIRMIEYVSLDYINFYEDKTPVSKPEIPQGLLDKCENIRNQDPELMKGQGLLNRFK